jgi:hypothetical protein
VPAPGLGGGGTKDGWLTGCWGCGTGEQGEGHGVVVLSSAGGVSEVGGDMLRRTGNWQQGGGLHFGRM